MVSTIAAFVSRQWQLAADDCRIEVEPLHGGLESTVLRARLTPSRPAPPIPTQLVVKHLAARVAREADVYDALWRHLEQPPAARAFGRDVSEHSTHLYLEHVAPWRAWPWSDVRLAAAVCRVLARLHDDDALPRHAFAWDYEAALSRSAQETLAVAHSARDEHGRRWWPRLGDLRRVAAALPRLRETLLGAGRSVIHGDMHPGNVILRGPAEADVVLLDWGRARIGSPIEDIASWLHALGCWEPEARRRHDTLMQAYLTARRSPVAFAGELRAHYWIASASNGLAGAIRYHLAVLGDTSRPATDRADSMRALAAWARVITRTAALLTPNRRRRSGSPHADRPAT